MWSFGNMCRRFSILRAGSKILMTCEYNIGICSIKLLTRLKYPQKRLDFKFCYWQKMNLSDPRQVVSKVLCIWPTGGICNDVC